MVAAEMPKDSSNAGAWRDIQSLFTSISEVESSISDIGLVVPRLQFSERGSAPYSYGSVIQE